MDLHLTALFPSVKHVALSILLSTVFASSGLATVIDENTEIVAFSAPSYWQPPAQFWTNIGKVGNGSTQAECAMKYAEQRLQEEAHRHHNSTISSTPLSPSRVTLLPPLQAVRSFRDEHNGLYHQHLVQTFNGVPLENGLIKVSIDSGNKIIAYASTLAPETLSAMLSVSSSRTPRFRNAWRPELSASEAVSQFAEMVGLPSVDLNLLEEESEPTDKRTDRALKVRVKHVPFSLGGEVCAGLKFFQTPEGGLELVWSLQIETVDRWLNAFVSATDGHMVAVSDWGADANPSATFRRDGAVGRRFSSFSIEVPKAKTAHLYPSSMQLMQAMLSQGEEASTSRQEGLRTAPETGISGVTYRVFPLWQNNPLEGDPVTLTDPQDLRYSKLGWHDAGNGSTPYTKGNNVFAFTDPYQNASLEGSDGFAFAPEYLFEFSYGGLGAEPSEYRDFSITNAFYVINAYHDLLYAYGFTPAAGNFQFVVDEAEGGGIGQDPVLVRCRDPVKKNNANFYTLPDGIPGRMNLLLWDASTPERDTALDNGVIIHELTHGLSGRLVGGADNPNCVRGDVQSRGLNEGWADAVSAFLRTKETDTRETDFVVAAYLRNISSFGGLRIYPVSTDLSLNSHTYSDMPSFIEGGQYYPIGELWTAALYEVFWNLIEKLGFTVNYKDDARSGKGNTVMLQLLVDGMKLVPCNPTMLQARDALLLADNVNNGGANHCEIWRGFAKRGIGFLATDKFEQSFDLPDNCP